MRMQGGLAGLLFLCVCQAVPAANSDQVNLTKHLVLDSRVIAQTNNVRLVLGTVQKEGRNPLFRADKLWENSLNNLYPNVAYDPGPRRFKLWYKDMICDESAIQQMISPRIIAHVGWFLLYATSKDGLAWTKPELDLLPFEGSTRNNIVAQDTANTGVFIDRHEPDPSRRYKMVHDEGRGNLRVRFSRDGIHWGGPIPAQIKGAVGDTHNNAFYDPRSGQYVLITRLFQGERKVARSQSKDFIHWMDAEVVLESLPSEKGRRQTYCMPAFPYANGYLGYVMMINTPGDSTVDCELTWSPDSVQWQRVNPGTPLIPRGAEGAYDSGCIYGPAGGVIARDGQLFIFYGGSQEKHIGRKRHCLLCLARLRIDGFAGYEPAQPTAPGWLSTQPLRCTGEPLCISADAKGGMIRVAVLDEKGLELHRCEPVMDNVTDREVKWRGGRFASLKGRTVRLKFELASARLYAFSGLELPPAKSYDH